MPTAGRAGAAQRTRPRHGPLLGRGARGAAGNVGDDDRPLPRADPARDPLRGKSAIAPATIDRQLSADRANLTLRGRSHTKPSTLLKDSIPMRTWAEWNDAVPRFVEIDLVGHEGGSSSGEFCFTLDITPGCSPRSC